VTLRVFPAQDGVKRKWTDVQDVPQGVRNVFIKAEDKRFYYHIGIDPVTVLARTIRNASARRVVSGTITMQLARLIKPHARALGGKIAEAVDALRLEARLSKDAILKMWLNAIPFGSNIEGPGAFSRARFGVTAAELDDVRAVALAVAPRHRMFRWRTPKPLFTRRILRKERIPCFQTMRILQEALPKAAVSVLSKQRLILISSFTLKNDWRGTRKTLSQPCEQWLRTGDREFDRRGIVLRGIGFVVQ
jgi:membrane carboxypeptidase/penicillin-binding protein PbpC